jgi:hypothetical protein
MCHDDVSESNRAEAREVPALDLFPREVPKLHYRPTGKGIKQSQYHGLRGIALVGTQRGRIFTWLMKIPQKKFALYVFFQKLLSKLRVPFLAMVHDELWDFERRPVELDFIAKKLCLQDYVLVEVFALR